MKATSPLSCNSRYSRVLWLLTLGLLAATAVSCGGSSTGAPPPPPVNGNTSVTLLLSSTGNDQLSQFEINLNSLSLTSKSGKTVDLFTTQQNPEFIHLNGKVEPLLTVSVPQDVYTAAKITVGDSGFTCVTLSPSGGLVTSYFGYMSMDTPTTVTLPTPITVTGSARALSLNLQVSQSASFPSSCYVQGIVPFSITPTFNLTAAPLTPQVSEYGMRGKIVSVSPSSNSFTLALAGGIMSRSNPSTADGQKVSFLTNEKTVYEGISGFSAVASDMLISVDAVIQSDGSQLATHISVADADTTNLSVMTGTPLYVSSSGPTLISFGQQNQGYLWTSGQAGQIMPYSFDAADFKISNVANLHDLPFVAEFGAANIFAGQSVYVSTHATALQGWPIYFPATTMTLIPQAINGTITGISAEGSFTTYNVALAPYELIPTLAVQAGQTTVLTDPTNMVVYVDSHTRMLNTQPLAVGSVVRFNGLVFNDNGIVRMDCGQVDDGVSVTPADTHGDLGSRLTSEQGTAFTRVSYDRSTGNVTVVHERSGRAK